MPALACAVRSMVNWSSAADPPGRGASPDPALVGRLSQLVARGRSAVTGAHTDYGAITLLATDGVAGLEVRPRGWVDWVPVDAPAGTFVVNLGDMLARWTNDRYVSTPHKVVARGAGDCWVSARVDGLRGLAVVLEGRGEGGLQVGRHWHQGSRVQEPGVQGQGWHRYI